MASSYGRHRRLVISESDSEHSFPSAAEESDAYSSSSDDEEPSTNSTNNNNNNNDNDDNNEADCLVASMGKVSISRTCQRGGIDSLNFFEDDTSDDDDSSIEELRHLPPTFQPKSKSPDAETQDPLSSSDDDQSFQSAKQELSDDDEENEDDCSNKDWTFDKSRKEFSVSSETVRMPKLRVPAKLFHRLFEHQKTGVVWMAGLHSGKIGGLLGDDMGMGKTYMALTFLGGLMRAKTIKNALVLAPLSVLRSWEREAHKVAKICAPNVCIQVIGSGVSKTTRNKRLRDALECSVERPHIIIATYGLVRSSPMDFVHESSRWDYMILDEAHTIKNPLTAISKACRRVAKHPETRRILLTGTPIMNNLEELWALFDFCNSGKVLGKLQTFKNTHGKPIEDARNMDATAHVIRIGERANKELQQKVKPYFLQRLKIDFLADKLPKKRDYVVWINLSEAQRSMYSEYVNSGDSAVAHVLSGIKTSPLEAVTWLKKLCGHPILVDGEASSLKQISDMNRNTLTGQSSKLQVLDKLVEHLRNQGHRTLIFSQSTKMLDIIQRVLLRRVKLSRIDGSTKEKQRQEIVDDFNRSHSKVEVLLLSTKAAGVGLTLTGADRAIIYDPSWTPAEDSQAVDRCYRIGQNKEVAVFRFITAGSVEEKMYEKQVHKDGIRRAVMTSMGSATTRYFDKDGLRNLFTLGPQGKCEFWERLKERGLTSDDDRVSSKMVSHTDIVGVSSHDALYNSNALVTITDNAVSEETTQNPFSAAHLPPTHYEKTQASGTTQAKVMGRSQRALFGGRKQETSNTKTRCKDNAGEKENEKNVVTISDSHVPISARASKSINTVASTLKHAERLIEGGDRVGGLEVFMDLLEGKYAPLGKDEKMKVHQRAASVASDLDWL